MPNIKLQQKFENVPYGQYIMFDSQKQLKTDYSPLGLKIRVIIYNFTDYDNINITMNDSEVEDSYTLNNNLYFELSDYGVFTIQYQNQITRFNIDTFKIYKISYNNGRFIIID